MTSIEYKFSLGEVCGTKFHDSICYMELLEVVNTRNEKFFVDIRKFLPERCIPEFKLKPESFSVSNSSLWSSCIFWISDGFICEMDIFRFCNMSVNHAETYYGEDIVNKLFDISQVMTREQSKTPSLKTLFQFVDEGISWWAPIPDNRYVSRDGRDLNLEVICSMMVRFVSLYFISQKLIHVKVLLIYIVK